MDVAPNVVPNAVRDVNARFFAGEHYIGRLLCSDPRMEQVWKTLMKEGSDREQANPKAFKDRLDSLADNYRIETWGPLAPSGLADQACASFFLAASIIFGVGNRTVKEYDVEQEAERWRSGAALCREALSSPHRAKVDPTLSAALLMSAEYFEEWAKLTKTASVDDPYLIKRRAIMRAPGGDENIRGQVRDVAAVTKKIFGQVLYGTIGTTANVAMNLEVTGRNVEKWCADLPDPSP